jgi:hypothetical protein
MLPFSRKTLLVVAAALPALAAGYFLPHFFTRQAHTYLYPVFDTVLRSSVIVVIYTVMLVWLKPSKDLESYLLSIRQNKRLF